MPKAGVSDHARLKERLKTFQFRRCAAHSCGTDTTGLSSYCRKHREAKRRTGDASGNTVSRSLVGKIRTQANTYLLANRAHPAIEEGLSWAYRWVQSGQSFGTSWRGLQPRQAAKQFLSRLRDAEIHEADVLGVIAAMMFIREHLTKHIVSDVHFRHQTIVHILGLSPWPSESSSDGARVRHFRPMPQAVDVLWSQIPAPILRLGYQIADKIYEDDGGPRVNEGAINQPLPKIQRKKT